MSTPPAITSHLIPMDEDDVRRNIQRIVVEVPRNRVGEIADYVGLLRDSSDLIASGTIRAEDITSGTITASGGWCAPVTFTGTLSPQAYRIVTGFAPPEETLL